MCSCDVPVVVIQYSQSIKVFSELKQPFSLCTSYSFSNFPTESSLFCIFFGLSFFTFLEVYLEGYRGTMC